MLRNIAHSEWLRKLRFPLIVFGLMYYFGSSLMGGENGYYAKQRTMAELEGKQAELETLRATREALDKKVALMSPGNLDRDLLDEQARAVLGLADKTELVIILDGNGRLNRPGTTNPSAE
jgi:cell division protein FtsB